MKRTSSIDTNNLKNQSPDKKLNTGVTIGTAHDRKSYLIAKIEELQDTRGLSERFVGVFTSLAGTSNEAQKQLDILMDFIENIRPYKDVDVVFPDIDDFLNDFMNREVTYISEDQANRLIGKVNEGERRLTNLECFKAFEKSYENYCINCKELDTVFPYDIADLLRLKNRNEVAKSIECEQFGQLEKLTCELKIKACRSLQGKDFGVFGVVDVVRNIMEQLYVDKKALFCLLSTNRTFRGLLGKIQVLISDEDIKSHYETNSNNLTQKLQFARANKHDIKIEFNDLFNKISNVRSFLNEKLNEFQGSIVAQIKLPPVTLNENGLEMQYIQTLIDALDSYKKSIEVTYRES